MHISLICRPTTNFVQCPSAHAKFFAGWGATHIDRPDGGHGRIAPRGSASDDPSASVVSDCSELSLYHLCILSKRHLVVAEKIVKNGARCRLANDREIKTSDYNWDVVVPEPWFATVASTYL